MNEQKPSVGRVVHYVSHGTPPRADGSQAYTSECRAAVITQVGDGTVGLCVLNPAGMFFREAVEPGTNFIDELHNGTWHWPERV